MVRYESLPNFYFNCELIYHTVNSCPKITGEIMMAQRKLFSYQAWLIGSMDKGELVKAVRREAEVECRDGERAEHGDGQGEGSKEERLVP